MPRTRTVQKTLTVNESMCGQVVTALRTMRPEIELIAEMWPDLSREHRAAFRERFPNMTAMIKACRRVAEATDGDV